MKIGDEFFPFISIHFLNYGHTFPNFQLFNWIFFFTVLAGKSGIIFSQEKIGNDLIVNLIHFFVHCNRLNIRDIYNLFGRCLFGAHIMNWTQNIPEYVNFWKLVSISASLVYNFYRHVWFCFGMQCCEFFFEIMNWSSTQNTHDKNELRIPFIPQNYENKATFFGRKFEAIVNQDIINQMDAYMYGNSVISMYH